MTGIVIACLGTGGFIASWADITDNFTGSSANADVTCPGTISMKMTLTGIFATPGSLFYRVLNSSLGTGLAISEGANQTFSVTVGDALHFLANVSGPGNSTSGTCTLYNMSAGGAVIDTFTFASSVP